MKCEGQFGLFFNFFFKQDFLSAFRDHIFKRVDTVFVPDTVFRWGLISKGVWVLGLKFLPSKTPKTQFSARISHFCAHGFISNNAGTHLSYDRITSFEFLLFHTFLPTVWKMSPNRPICCLRTVLARRPIVCRPKNNSPNWFFAQPSPELRVVTPGK